LWQDYCDFLAVAYKDNKKYSKQITVLIALFDRMMLGDTEAMHIFADILDDCPIFAKQHHHYYILSGELAIQFHASV